MQIDPLDPLDCSKIQIWKIQDGGGRHLENRHISEVVWLVATKYDTETQFERMNASDR